MNLAASLQKILRQPQQASLKIMLEAVRLRIFRLNPDQILPIVLGQRRIYIVPTSAGYLFVAVLMVMMLGAINYALSLGHALVFLLAGLGMTAMVHTFRNLLGIEISPGRAVPVYAGQIARFPLYLANKRKDTRRALSFRFSEVRNSENDQKSEKGEEVFTDIPNDGRATIIIPCPAPRRGRLQPGHITLTSFYPLGLFRAWAYPHPQLSCLVYPTPLSRPLPPPTAVDEAGFARGDAGREDFAGLRPHTPSDPPRHVAWKAVARSPDAWPLLVKHFAGGTGEELWLDWQLLSREDDDEIRLSILTGWVLAAEQMQLAYGLSLPGLKISPATGAAHSDHCLEALALYGIDTYVPLA